MQYMNPLNRRASESLVAQFVKEGYKVETGPTSRIAFDKKVSVIQQMDCMGIILHLFIVLTSLVTSHKHIIHDLLHP